MAGKFKNIIIRRKYKQTELKQLVLKYLSVGVDNNIYYFYNSKLTAIGFKWSISKIKSFCVFTLRKSSVFNFFKLSRNQIKESASYGRLNGMRKSSW